MAGDSENNPDEGQWHNGNGYETFVKLMSLKQTEPNSFKSAFPAYSPGGGTRAYGGHVYAQAALAAARTVGEGFVIHSVNGHFTLEGLSSVPFIYKVRTIRNGGNYCQRHVDAYQDNPRLKRRKAHLPTEDSDLLKGIDGSGTGRSDDTETACFTATISFKRSEPSVIEMQRPAQLLERFPMLKGKKPDDWDECPGVDSPWYWPIEAEYGKCKFPGLKSTKVDMTSFNQDKSVLDRRQLQWYRVIGDMPDVHADPNLHAAAHLYASDRNGLFVVPNFLDMGNNFSAMASLSHTVIFHTNVDDMSMDKGSGEGDSQSHWFVQELQVDRIGSGRATVSGRIWREDGLHVLSHYQDGLCKMRLDDEDDDDNAEKSKAVFSKGKL